MATVYARTDKYGRLIGITSGVYLEDTTGWVQVDEGEGSRYVRAQVEYLDGPARTEDGVCRYAVVEGTVVARSEEEVQADRESTPEPTPGKEDMLIRMLVENSMLTDEQILQVPSAFREWRAGTRERPQGYAAEEIVQRDDALYRCEQGHLNHGQADWGPGVAVSLWTALGVSADDLDAIPEWARPTGAHDAYQPEQRVQHKGQMWMNVLTTPNTWEPGVHGWEAVE